MSFLTAASDRSSGRLFCGVALVLVAMSLSTVAAARGGTKAPAHPQCHPPQPPLHFKFFFSSPRPQRCHCIKRRLRYVADFWAALGQAAACQYFVMWGVGRKEQWRVEKLRADLIR